MSKIGQLWTNSVAYVALMIGAGLSIAGNVADTFRTRGTATDSLDVILAIAWPALVVLMVELFVSTRWIGTGRSMQVIRWIGTIGIGLMAMRVSWVHLNDLLLSRGQAGDVAFIGPLAIDSLAIMATALILSGRVARDIPAPSLPAATASRDTAEDIAALSYSASEMSLFDRLAGELEANTTPAYVLDSKPISAPPATRPESVPADAAAMIEAWRDADRIIRPAAGTVDTLVAAAFTISTKTAQRWRIALGAWA